MRVYIYAAGSVVCVKHEGYKWKRYADRQIGMGLWGGSTEVCYKLLWI